MSISQAESEVMEVLWRRHPQSADDIVAEIAEAQNWGEATVKTLLNRLLKKKAISATRAGRRYLYSPILTRDDYVGTESRGLIDRLFEGRLSSLVMHFSQKEKLNAAEIAELKKMIAEMEDD